MKKIWSILKDTVEAFFRDDVIHWGASLAYYSLLSLGPLLILGITVFGRAVGAGPAESWILEQVQILAGGRARAMAQTVLTDASQPNLSSLGAILTIGLLLFGATAVFNNLQGALNRIWGVQAGSHMIKNILRTRLAAFFMVVALGVLLLVSVLVSTLLNWVGPLLDPIDSILPFVKLAELLTSVILLWLLVAAIFRILPDVKISWRDVWMGSLATATLLYVGKVGISAFLATTARASMYGAAGSLFLLLMWVYFSAQVFFIGAEFTQVWARHQGRDIQPESYAFRVHMARVDEDPQSKPGEAEEPSPEGQEAGEEEK